MAPNRMSPARASMFYGAFDTATAEAETLDPEKNASQIMSIGTFRALRPLRLLDLAELPSVPSVFDPDNQHLIHPIRFPRDFACDIVKPIVRDGREHIGYVPTRIDHPVPFDLFGRDEPFRLQPVGKVGEVALCGTRSDRVEPMIEKAGILPSSCNAQRRRRYGEGASDRRNTTSETKRRPPRRDIWTNTSTVRVT